MKSYSLQPLIQHFSLPHPLDFPRIFGNHRPVTVEIGFGMGEVLVGSALKNRHRNYVGIEQHWPRIVKTFKRIENVSRESGEDIDNIRILKEDARTVFERLILPRYLDKVYSLFPCPWPKKKHVKHRLFNRQFLKLVNSRLKEEGALYIVTDHDRFSRWIIQESAHTGFETSLKKIEPRFDTKFERKWTGEGIDVFYEITCRKREHVDIPIKEGCVLKSFKLDSFDPDGFVFEDQRGDVAVIFKDFLFDPSRQRGTVRLLISEGHMTQNFRVQIFFDGRTWRICKTDGQNFFPTPGVVRALELVYNAAKKSTAATSPIS